MHHSSHLNLKLNLYYSSFYMFVVLSVVVFIYLCSNDFLTCLPTVGDFFPMFSELLNSNEGLILSVRNVLWCISCSRDPYEPPACGCVSKSEWKDRDWHPPLSGLGKFTEPLWFNTLTHTAKSRQTRLLCIRLYSSPIYSPLFEAPWKTEISSELSYGLTDHL